MELTILLTLALITIFLTFVSIKLDNPAPIFAAAVMLVLCGLLIATEGVDYKTGETLNFTYSNLTSTGFNSTGAITSYTDFNEILSTTKTNYYSNIKTDITNGFAMLLMLVGSFFAVVAARAGLRKGHK